MATDGDIQDEVNRKAGLKERIMDLRREQKLDQP